MMTPKERAAMQQALEALKICNANVYVKGSEAITVLREALAEQEQVAYHVTAGRRVSDGIQVMFGDDEILYAAPVLTKDLTDDEIMKVFRQQAISASWPDIFRAVIAADREKNK